MTDPDDKLALLCATFGIDTRRIEPLGHGLINRTWRVEAADGRRWVLQHVNPVFPPGVNHDIDVVTRHLEAAGLVTPRLVLTPQQQPCLDANGEIWRLMSFVDGISRDALDDPRQAGAAGALLGRFHRCVNQLEHRFANPRLGVHDTARHLAALRAALDTHREHPAHAAVTPLAEEILTLAGELPPASGSADRIVHGDPKINNFLFDADSGDALCLIDLDTVGPMPLCLELGDALRSWCNPDGEDRRTGHFSTEIFAAAVAGYASTAGDWIEVDETSAIVPAVGQILVELAARFCADALNENYFGWDPARFGSRSEHNQVRAAGQLAVLRSLRTRQSELDAIVAQTFT